MALGFILKELGRGKSLGRAMQNEHLARELKSLKGDVLDIGGGSGSYYRFIPPAAKITRTNIKGSDLDSIVDLNKSFPFEAGTFNAVLVINALYIAENPGKSATEMRRVLREGGTLLLATPYLMPEMREPHDYWRFTSEGLQKLCADAGFTDIRIIPVGERFSSSANLFDGAGTRIGRILFGIPALLLDALLPQKIKDAHPAPISYIVVAH